MSSALQTSQALPMQRNQETATDTTQTADTLSLSDVLRADRTLLENPADTVGAFFRRVGAALMDPDLWIGLAGLLLHILLILVLAFVAIRVIDRVTARWTRRVEDLPLSHPRRQRTYTISNLVSSTARYVLWPVAIIMVLSEMAIDVGALIATAGIAGLAIGFGAQTLVKDVISGVFLLFDDSIHVGDFVRINGETGTVEEIGVRLIRVRKLDGEVLMVPAGELRIFGNRSIDYARVIVNVGLSYEQDTERILPVMERVANEWAEEHRDILMEEKPTVQALTDFGESSVRARIMVQVRPGEQFQAERDLRLLLKRAFDELGIEIPFPRRTLYLREQPESPPRRITDPRQEASEEALSDTQGSD